MSVGVFDVLIDGCLLVTKGEREGMAIGLLDGIDETSKVGCLLPITGETEGILLGNLLGVSVGESVGCFEMSAEGCLAVFGEREGTACGAIEGKSVGISDTFLVGCLLDW